MSTPPDGGITNKYYAAIPLRLPPWLIPKIDPDDLDFQPGKIPIETRHHVSVHVMLPNKPTPQLEAKIRAIEAFNVELGPLGCFHNDKNDVLFLKVDVTEPLLRLHQLLVNEYKIPWRHPSYTPHVTLAFLKPGRAEKYTQHPPDKSPLNPLGRAFADKLEFHQHASPTKDDKDILTLLLRQRTPWWVFAIAAFLLAAVGLGPWQVAIGGSLLGYFSQPLTDKLFEQCRK